MQVNILTAIVVAVMDTAAAAQTNFMLADEPGTLKCNYVTTKLSGSTPQKSSCKVVILCKNQML